MVKENVRRTFNINNFESLTIEGDGEDPDPTRARLLAVHSLLSKASAEMIRIFNVRQQYNTSSEYDGITYNQVTTELQWITTELENLKTVNT
jgi:hypothetical protein